MNEAFDYEISAKKNALNINFKELWKYRDLIGLLVKRDYVAVYKQTVLGPVWFFVQPIITSLIFTVIFGNVANLAPEGKPAFLFFLCGQTFWNYFGSCITATSNTFVANASVFGKVYFPRLAVPISVIISNLLKFSLQFILLICVWLFYYLKGGYNIKPDISLVFIPLYLVVMAILGLGAGLVISSLTTRYRDFTFLVGFGVQLLMWATPVVYHMDAIKNTTMIRLIKANPMTSIIEGAKYGFDCGGSFDPLLLLYSSLFGIVLLLFGIVVFNRVEKTFMDTV
ncbi:MAG: ABC transporter permease [Bacteroidota bacterium]